MAIIKTKCCGLVEWDMERAVGKVQLFGARPCKEHVPYLRFETADGVYVGAVDGKRRLRSIAHAILRAIGERSP